MRLQLRLLKHLPFFPAIPLVPIALVIGSVTVSILALQRVRRLERRLAAA
jgi:hypothetical protein